MKKLRILMMFAVLSPALAQAAALEVDLKKYLAFAQEWTAYKYNGEPLPKVQIERDAIVQIYGYGELAVAQAEIKGEDLAKINAVYLSDTKTIYVSDQVDITDAKSEATLVHEMVHYLQDISGYTKSLNGHVACTESEAYDVQALWQQLNKIDVEGLPLVYQQSLLAATRCMGNKTSAFEPKEK